MAYSQDTIVSYKKRVLESVEIDLLASYYSQDGDNAAVTGGIGTEELTDLASSIVVSIPLNDDDVLKIDANVSAYTSASSSNVSPFDSGQPADPFVADSGASANDLWLNGVVSYSHSSDDRNNIWGANVSVSQEYDYASFGFGGNYSYLLNDKNTELSIRANVFLDSWKIIYPFELRPFEDLGYTPLKTNKRNSYAIGFGFSQILSKKSARIYISRFGATRRIVIYSFSKSIF